MASAAGPDLYPDLLGPGWASLPEVVRRLHQAGRARGLVTIERGRPGPPRWLGRVLGFPPAGDHVPTLLTVERLGAGQTWRRRFGEHTLVSRQERRAVDLLAERFGPFECVFRLHPTARGIDYHLAGAAVVLGGLRVPLPRSLAPRVSATTRAEEDAMGLDVTIAAPLFGKILRYHGLVRPEAAEVRA